jgi:hypothetical protein
MQAIEFEAIPEQHTIRIPEDIPDGVPLRVLLLWESPPRIRHGLQEPVRKRH